ncbi:unnamed protein product [Mytilus edulis]|uniref:Uncharacterized protein n=1 Tax=Mytilus edulis TaxID=6550 RepID=A0A8S3TKB4_MYTED|nr:unnamed protein product [Mytilus edulis]
MSGKHNLCLDFYKYLCQKIGYEDEVKVRRLTYIIDDLGIPSTTATQITSGSKGEGLQLKGSDLDLMFIDPAFKVYESESDFVPQSYITNHALRKCTDEKVYPWQIGLNQTQEYILHLLKRTELCTLSKLFTVRYPKFIENSQISPQELKLNKIEQALLFHPMIFAHFLSFLCYYHLHNIRSCNQCMPQLLLTIVQHLTSVRWDPLFQSLSIICLDICNQIMGETDCARECFDVRWDPLFHSLSIICLGRCSQMMGETDYARECFLLVTQSGELNLTSASIRLSNLDQI